MPHYAALLIFFGYLLFGIWTVLCSINAACARFSCRNGFLLAALLVPVDLFAVICLLVSFPVRGVAQAVIAWVLE